MRHQQAKEVVLGLRESIKEKDEIIKELKDKSSGQNTNNSQTSLKETVSVAGANVVRISFWYLFI